MPRPLIGIAPRYLPGDDGPTAVQSAPTAVAEAVAAAGGEPMVLTCADADRAREALEVVQAVVMPGGGDSDPALYGETARDPRLRLVDPRQDGGDLAIIRAAVARRMPLLAICRGMQTVNIALGGSLVQHLDEESTRHHWGTVHRLRVTEDDSVVARALRPQVGRSFHQQAVRRLGRDLRVTARAEDGVVEAIEHTTAPLLGLQWHPELDVPGCPRQLGPFVWLVQQATDAARTSRFGPRTAG